MTQGIKGITAGIKAGTLDSINDLAAVLSGRKQKGGEICMAWAAILQPLLTRIAALEESQIALRAQISNLQRKESRDAIQ
jgi:hypothetical protein